MLWDDKVAPWGVGLLCTQWQVGAWGAKVPPASIQAALYISIHCILAALYSIHSYSLGNLPNVLSTGPSPVLLYSTPRTQQALCQIFLSTPTKKGRTQSPWIPNIVSNTINYASFVNCFESPVTVYAFWKHLSHIVHWCQDSFLSCASAEKKHTIPTKYRPCGWAICCYCPNQLKIKVKGD